MAQQERDPVQISSRPQTRPIEPTIRLVPFGTRHGVMAGLAMGFYVLLLELIGFGENMVLQSLMYIILSIVIYLALRAYKFSLPEGKTFQYGIAMGAITSSVAGLVFALFHMIAFFIGQENLAFEYWTMEVDTLPDALLLAVAYILMIFVGGMFATFASIQFLKEKSTPE